MKSKTFFCRVLTASILVAGMLVMSGCFKDLDQSSDDPSNPGGGSGGNSLNSGLLAYYSFDDGTGVEGTTNHVDGILLGGATTIEGIRGNGVHLNFFQNQYFNIPYTLFRGLEQFSVSLWIRDFGPGCIFAAQNTSGSSEYSDAPYFYAAQNGKFAMKCDQQNDNSYNNCPQFAYNYQTQGIQSGAWHHLVVTFNSGTVKLYVDGSLVDQMTINYSVNVMGNCSKVVFGGDKEGGYATGSSMCLDEINIYNREVTASEVKGLYKVNY